MKINVEFDGGEEKSLVTFYLDEFKGERDYVVALSIIETFAADFSLDPELGPEDVQDLANQCQEKGSDAFVVEMSEEGIEVDLGGQTT